jgi:hypothetical protein
MSTARILLRPALFLMVTHAVAAAQATPPGKPDDRTPRLLTVRRLCIGQFAGEESDAAVAKEIAIASLYASKKFVITEKCDGADAVLKGALIEKSGFKAQSEGEGTSFAGASGSARGSVVGALAEFGALGLGGSEKLSSAETRRHASVSLRLVDKDGEVLWAHSFDSPGGKSKGALADAVDRTIRSLIREVEKLQKPAPVGQR